MGYSLRRSPGREDSAKDTHCLGKVCWGGGGGGSADGVCRVDCMGLRVGTVQKTDLTWVAVTLLGWGEGGGLGVRCRHRAPAGPSVRHGGVTATG